MLCVRYATPAKPSEKLSAGLGSDRKSSVRLFIAGNAALVLNKDVTSRTRRNPYRYIRHILDYACARSEVESVNLNCYLIFTANRPITGVDLASLLWWIHGCRTLKDLRNLTVIVQRSFTRQAHAHFIKRACRVRHIAKVVTNYD